MTGSRPLAIQPHPPTHPPTEWNVCGVRYWGFLQEQYLRHTLFSGVFVLGVFREDDNKHLEILPRQGVSAFGEQAFGEPVRPLFEVLPGPFPPRSGRDTVFCWRTIRRTDFASAVIPQYSLLWGHLLCILNKDKDIILRHWKDLLVCECVWDGRGDLKVPSRLIQGPVVNVSKCPRARDWLTLLKSRWNLARKALPVMCERVNSKPQASKCFE